MSYWEPDDLPELPDGWLDDDTVEELRALLRVYEYPDLFPQPGNRNHAVLVLIDHILNPPRFGAVTDPHILWAKTLLGDAI